MILLMCVLCILLFFVFNKNDDKKNRRRFVCIITIALIIVSGLRHESVGSDTAGYMMNYENQERMAISSSVDFFWKSYVTQSDNSEKDPGYTLFVAILSKIIPSARAFLFIIAAISMGALASFVHKNVLTLKGLLFFYVFYISLFFGYIPNSAIRQSLALSFVLIGYGFLQKQQFIKFAGIVLLGSFFHMSALVALILIPISLIKNVKTVSYLGFVLFLGALTNVNRFASFFLSGNDVYNAYIRSNFYGTSSRPIVVIILFLGLYLICFLGMIKDKSLKENKCFFYGSFLSLIFSSLIWVDPSLIRITAYFAPLMGVCIAASFDKIKQGNILFWTVILIFLFSSLRNLDDYHFMWEKNLMVKFYKS